MSTNLIQDVARVKTTGGRWPPKESVMHQQINRFVPRVTWLLAVAMFVFVTFFVTSAQAQQPTITTRSATITLAERERFERVYVGLVEGIAPEVFERCVRWGQDCPSALSLPADTLPHSVRSLRDLRSFDDTVESPGTIATRLLDARVLSARCLLDTSVGSTQERAWTSVSLSRRALRRYPWRPSKWVSHRCRGTPVIHVRPHRPIEYLVAVRPAEAVVHDFIKTQAESGTGNASPQTRRDQLTRDVRAFAPVLGSALPPSTWRDVARTLFAALQQELARPPRTVRVTTTVAVPANESNELRNLKIFSALFVLGFFVVCSLLVVEFIRHKRATRDLIDEWRKRLAEAQEAFDARLTAECAEARTEGKKEGVRETESSVNPVLNFVLSAMLGGDTRVHSGSIADRAQKVLVGWGGFIQKVENRGRDKATEDVATREAALRKEGAGDTINGLHTALTKLGLKLEPPTADTDAAAFASIVYGAVTRATQDSHERLMMLATRPTRDFAPRDPALKALEGLTLEQVVRLAPFFHAVRARLPEGDARRSITWDDPNKMIAMLLEYVEEMLQKGTDQYRALEQRLSDWERSIAGAIQAVALDVQGAAVTLDASSEGQEPKPSSVIDFGPEGIMQPMKAAMAFLWKAVYNSIRDTHRVDWMNPPEPIRRLVDLVDTLNPPDQRHPADTDYRARADSAATLLEEFLSRSIRVFTNLGSEMSYLRDRAEAGLRKSVVPAP